MQRTSIKGAGRLLVLASLSTMLVVLGLTLGAQTASAAPQLDVASACEPDPVRPGPAVITCTLSITNSGDEVAAGVETSLLPSPNCSLPTPAIPPLLYLYVNGVLQEDNTSLPLTSNLGDLSAGQTKEIVTKVAVQNLRAGRFGAALTVTALDVSEVTTDLCWTVDAAAADPPTNVTLTKTLVSPAPGTPGIINEASFEIVARNAGAQEITSLALIDIVPFGFDLVSASPPASGSDPLGRPTWDLGAFGLSSLAAGGVAEVSLTLRVQENVCANVDNVSVVQATIGGEQQDYAAFADRTVVLGDCSEPPEPQYCIYYAPDGENTDYAPCDEAVCWSLTPGTDFYQPAYDCEAEHCWFSPPGDGSPPTLDPCGEEVCWINFGGDDFEFYDSVPCDFEFCEFTAPDGSESVRDSCDFPICWSSPPEGGSWEPIFGCGEFGEECWATPPFDAPSTLFPCQFEPCFFAPPANVITYSFGDRARPCEFVEEEPLCWPVSTDGAEAFMFGPVPCDSVDSYCVFTPPGGGVAFVLFCEDLGDVCWGIDEEIADLIGLPPDTLIPRPCELGEEPTVPSPPASVPVEVVQGTLTNADIVEGNVETIEPLPSENVEPATLEPSSRVEPIDEPPPPPPGDDDTNTPPIDTNSPTGNDDDDEPDDLRDVLGFGRPPQRNVAAPDAGYGPSDNDGGGVWLLVAVALAGVSATCIGAGLAVRRRPS